MSRPATVRKYGKLKKPKSELLFTELPPSPVKVKSKLADPISELTEQLNLIRLDVPKEVAVTVVTEPADRETEDAQVQQHNISLEESQPEQPPDDDGQDLRILTWDDVCPPGDQIEKIAEASYAEVYRVTNERGTSIIKVIRLDSPIKPQTRAQERSGLVDEMHHSEDDLLGELRISEWLADVPGFVVYKERYIVRGKAPKALLETHQTFHRKAKRKDPDRAQFYPSPSRYLDDTRFLVVELGDAGTALEDLELVSTTQIWDIFLHVAIALARAEDQIKFEHRDLHEGNLCIRQCGTPKKKDDKSSVYFGYSGLEITILDYGLSRAEDLLALFDPVVAYDLEKDLSFFTSCHAKQCKVYRQMRSFLLKGDRSHLPPAFHRKPYELGPEGPISWNSYNPYSNVLWLAYLYEYMTDNFRGDAKDLSKFRKTTTEFWSHLNPEAPHEILSFSCAMDAIRYAIESGWLTELQLSGEKVRNEWSEAPDESYNESIIEIQIVDRDESELRRSPRRRRPRILD